MVYLQACIFNTWGPIAQSAKLAFCWSDATVAWTNNVMLIVGMVSVPFSYSILQMFGLRHTDDCHGKVEDHGQEDSKTEDRPNLSCPTSITTFSKCNCS